MRMASASGAWSVKRWIALSTLLVAMPVCQVFADWQVTSYAGGDGDPSIAWNGNHYLITWQRDRNDTALIYGRMVTSSREFAGDEIPIWDPIVSSAPDAARYPRVSASGGGGSRWLVVWRNEYAGVMEIRGRIINNDGTAEATVLTVGTTDYFSPVPVIAWNGSKWLVVWEGYTTYRWIQGRFVYTNGSMGPVFDIDKEVDVQKYRARVGALGSNFFVAWMDRRDGVYNIYGKSVDTNGVTGSRVSVHACDASDYTNTVSGGDSYFLVTWRCLGTGGNAHIWGRRVNSTGSATVGTEFEISSDQIYNSGASAWTGSYFKVAYDLASQGPYYRPVYEDGSMGSETDLSSLLASGVGTYLANAQGDTNCLCVWEANIGNPDIYADGESGASGIESDLTSVTPPRLSVTPNPLSDGRGVVKFRIGSKGAARIDVYNIAGQRLATVLNRDLEPGEHSIELSAKGLPAGVYLVRLAAKDGSPVTKKMVYLK
jgi:hypothetical protein